MAGAVVKLSVVLSYSWTLSAALDVGTVADEGKIGGGSGQSVEVRAVLAALAASVSSG